MELSNSGIFDEKSDIRAHVAPLARQIIVYQTADMLSLLSNSDGKFTASFASQPGANDPTARGFIVPVESIPGVRIITSTLYPWDEFPPEKASTSEKGAAAMHVVTTAMACGRFPIWIKAAEEKGIDSQLSGTDIHLQLDLRVQVKCDYRAGNGHEKCTGNIFVQTHERNPFRLF